MRIAYLFSQPRKKLIQGANKGFNPDQMLYGLSYLKHLGHDIFVSDKALIKPNIFTWLLSPLQPYCLKHLKSGFQLDQALRLAQDLNRADLIITTNDTCGLAVALLKKIGLIKTYQIYFHIIVKTSGQTSKWLKSFIKTLLHQPEAIVCFSQDRISKLQRSFKIKKSKLHFIPPGVDTRFYQPKKRKPVYDLVAVGRDSDRDYASLIKAAGSLKLKTKIICDPKNISAISLPDNVSVYHFQTYRQIRTAYQQAKLVVVPVKKNSVSGQISFLEALSCGKPVLASDTPALNQSFALLSATKLCHYYRPEDPTSLKQQLQKCFSQAKNFTGSQSQSTQLKTKFSSLAFAKKLNNLIANVKPTNVS